MKEQLQLTPRLQAVADLVPKGARLADVGTDHAHLPVWLLLEGRISGAIASDIRPGPLERAKGTVEAYRVEERVSLRLCPGLEGITAHEVDTVTICGMGGDMMTDILGAAPLDQRRGHPDFAASERPAPAAALAHDPRLRNPAGMSGEGGPSLVSGAAGAGRQ